MNKEPNIMDVVKLVSGVFLLLIGIFVFFGSYTIVNPGERGVYIVLGKASDTVMDEGFHFKLPFISTVKKLSIQVQKNEDRTDAASKDMQKVTATITLNWHIRPETVPMLYRTIGDETTIHDRIISPAISEVLKAASAKMTAEEILTRRLELKQNIDEMLIKRLSTYQIMINDVSLVNLDFTKEFNDAVESKQIAEQTAKRAEYVAQQAIQDAKARVNEAKGEAEANLTTARAQSEAQKLLRQTLTPEILQLEYLKAWNGALPSVMGSPNGVMMFNMQLNNTSTKNKENE